MRKFSLIKTLTTMVILIGLSLPANAELIGTGKPGANSTESSSCDWLSNNFFNCLTAWWE